MLTIYTCRHTGVWSLTQPLGAVRAVELHSGLHLGGRLRAARETRGRGGQGERDEEKSAKECEDQMPGLAGRAGSEPSQPD